MLDCLIVGFNDVFFKSYVSTVREMGADSIAYRDLNLAFVTHDRKPYRRMDLLNLFRREADPLHRPLSNVEFLWSVILYLSSHLSRRLSPWTTSIYFTQSRLHELPRYDRSGRLRDRSRRRIDAGARVTDAAHAGTSAPLRISCSATSARCFIRKSARSRTLWRMR